MKSDRKALLRAFNSTAWAILPETLDSIQAAVEAGASADSDAMAAIGRPVRGMEPRDVSSGVAVIPIHGVVTHRASGMAERFGWATTEGLSKRITEAASAAGTIVLDIDSPGGSVSGVQELASTIRAVRSQGVRVIASVNDLAASAAYWIASQADEIAITPSGSAGSIGVFLRHMDVSKAMEEAGVTVTMIHAGPFKVEGHPYAPLSDEARAHLQSQVDDYYQAFVSDVAQGRGIMPERVESRFGGGRTLTAKRAQDALMVDRIATLDEVLAGLGVDRGTGRPLRRASAIAATTNTVTLAELALACPESLVFETVAQDTANGVAVEANEMGVPDPVDAPEGEENTMSNLDKVAHEGATKEPSVEFGADATAAERERASTIFALASAHGLADKAHAWVESGAPVGRVVNEIRSMTRDSQPEPARPGAAMPDISTRERREYSIAKLIRSQLDGEDGRVDAGYELEVSQEMARILEQDPKGVFLSTALAFGRPQAALDTATSTGGQELVFTEFGGFIDLLRPRSVVLQAGAQMLPGLRGNVAIPRQTGGATGSWVAETPGSDVGDTDLTLDQVTLSPKTYQASTAYSRQLLRQSTPIVDALVRQDLIRRHATALDAAAIAGTGASNQPTGVIYQSGIGDVAGGTNGLAPTFTHMVDLETDVAAANADDLGAMAYITTPGIRGVLKKTQQFSGSNGAPIWTGPADGGSVNGYAAYASNNVPSNLTKGTASGIAHAVVFGVWSQMLIGEWGAADLIVDPYRLKKQGVIEVTSFQMVDVQLRQAAAFSAMLDALLS